MTPEEMHERLRAAGIDVDARWKGSPQPGSRQAPLPPTFARQRLLLEQMLGLLRTQVEQDREKIADLREKLARLKHGGGV